MLLEPLRQESWLRGIPYVKDRERVVAFLAADIAARELEISG